MRSGLISLGLVMVLATATGSLASHWLEGDRHIDSVSYQPEAVLRMKPSRVSTLNLLQVDTLFTDDFESGIGNWTGDWGLTDEQAHSPDSSLTDSPYANYPHLANLFSYMASGVDLSSYLGAVLIFWKMHWLEEGFDFGYLEVSTDGGTSWIELKEYNDTLDVWTPDTTDIGGFCGNSDVRVGFRVVTDPAYAEEGWFVDDVLITGSMEDLTPPLILHTPPADTESVPQDLIVVAQITDQSGVASDSLCYRFDGGGYTDVTHDSLNGNTYYFTIPERLAGTFVDYYLVATDNAASPNRGETEVFSYVAGTVIYYDDGEEEFVYGYGPGWSLAVRFTHGADSAFVTTGIYRFYMDTSHPLDSVWIHLWDDMGGIPGSDIIPTFKIWPSNTPEEPMAWTKVDLRPYSVIVPAADFHLGCEFISTYPYLSGDDPPVSGRTSANTGTGWFPGSNDAYIRVVVGLNPTGVEELQEARSQRQEARLHQNYPNPFTAVTSVQFSVPSGFGDQRTSLRIYDVCGRLTKTLFDEVITTDHLPLTTAVSWDGTDDTGEAVASGVYFYRLTASKHGGEAERFSSTKRMVLLR